MANWLLQGGESKRGKTRAQFVGQFAFFEQMQNGNTQLRQQPVGQIRVQGTGALQYIVHLRLRNPQDSGQPALGVFAVLYTKIYGENETLEKRLKKYLSDFLNRFHAEIGHPVFLMDRKILPPSLS